MNTRAGPAYPDWAPVNRGVFAAKGKGPLSTLASPRVRARRAPESVSKARPAAEETLRLILTSLENIKAEETLTIDLRGKTSIGDYMVVTSGRSNRHVGSIADNVLKDLNKAGVPDVRVEGMPHCDWVLIDSGDVIVHVFRPEVRAFYNLEKMWTTARPDGRRAS